MIQQRPYPYRQSVRGPVMAPAYSNGPQRPPTIPSQAGGSDGWFTGLSPKKKRRVLYFATALVVLSIVLIIILIPSCIRKPCGNGRVDHGEDSFSCCIDAGCAEGELCIDDRCIPNPCGECEFFDGQGCARHECCSDGECGSTEVCVANSCIELVCEGCFFADVHTCVPYECCTSMDCDDGSGLTVDVCEKPNSPESRCINVVPEQERNSTICVGDNCISAEDECIDGDDRCPAGCTYLVDDDCKRNIDACGTDLGCLGEAAKDCTESDATMSRTVNNLGIMISYKENLEIIGSKNGSCLFSITPTSIGLSYSQPYMDQLKGAGFNESQIVEKEELARQSVKQREGVEMVCLIPPERLASILIGWGNGDYSGDDLKGEDCG